MKNILLLAVVATMLAGAATTTFASPNPTAHKVSVKKYPLEGYDNGSAAGKRWVAANNPSEEQLGLKWHEALCQVEFNTTQTPDQGRADYWQGFADSLNYHDNNTVSCY
jgi:hypothetical protein